MPFQGQPYYSYAPLGSETGVIRLCNIAKGHYAEPLKLGLREATIDPTILQYDALSYEWGHKGIDRWVLVNGTRFAVWPNLFSALKAVRRSDVDVCLWTDSICINQLDDIEKARQVAQMGEIYKNAERVLVWLGPESHNSNLAFDYMNGTTPHELGTKSNDVAEALRFLTRRSYWTRLWIRQEFILAKEIILLCGENATSLKNFAPHCTMNTHEVEFPIPWLEYGRFFEFDSPAAELIEHRKQYLSVHETPTLLRLILDSQSAKCSNICDRVFGLLGIASDCQQFRREMVDYNVDRTVLLLGLWKFYEGANFGFSALPILANVLKLNVHRFLQPEGFTRWFHSQFGNLDGSRAGLSGTMNEGDTQSCTEDHPSMHNCEYASSSFFYQQAYSIASRIFAAYQSPEFACIQSGTSLTMPSTLCAGEMSRSSPQQPSLMRSQQFPSEVTNLGSGVTDFATAYLARLYPQRVFSVTDTIPGLNPAFCCHYRGFCDEIPPNRNQWTKTLRISNTKIFLSFQYSRPFELLNGVTQKHGKNIASQNFLESVTETRSSAAPPTVKLQLDDYVRGAMVILSREYWDLSLPDALYLEESTRPDLKESRGELLRALLNPPDDTLAGIFGELGKRYNMCMRSCIFLLLQYGKILEVGEDDISTLQ